ncbi:acyl-CoA synthetase (AMP-forming)/AMP-acid ligase II [Mycobacterium sp. MAA66]|uniref:class I adenylate-forming enzyme family protein n=1 Tax=Mycobacterium sp. MAA66 TaxID=3156297 RepID=UPI003513908E
MVHRLSARISTVLDLEPISPAIEFENQWVTWGELADRAREIAGNLKDRPQVGVLLRNTPQHVAAVLGILSAGATLVVVNPARGDDRVKADLAALHLPVTIGDTADIAAVAPTIGSSATTIDTLTVVVAAVPGPIESRPGVAVRMLTSGTTGTPKRIDLTYGMLAHSVLGPEPTATRPGIAIVNAPLVHIGGIYRVLQNICEARAFVLLPRFELESWAMAVRTHRPKAVSLVPAALRTVLHSDLTADDLSGVKVVTSGTAPLSAEDADAFTEKFGIPVLTSYAATEFGGGVAGWTYADHQQFWHTKRGSVGRASMGAQLRVVDHTGAVVDAGEPGLLEVKAGQLGPGTPWLRTTDLARIDADGFLWILGRADQAIIRGGFKVMPDDVRSALESHPDVQGAAVVGRADPRLGETPVAMVELRAAVSADELSGYLRNRLAPYEIPTEIAVVDAIPRTPSGKADLTAVRVHFGSST